MDLSMRWLNDYINVSDLSIKDFCLLFERVSL